MELNYYVKDLSNYTNVRQVLKNEFNMSNRLITKLKQNKLVSLNNSETYLDKKIAIGDIISCNLDLQENSQNIVPIKMKLDILYEDDSFLIVNKPAGIAVHPSILHYEDSLSNGIKYYFNSINLKKKIRPVNRLDKDTTGIVIFAKNEYVQECLVRQMLCGNFYKEYFAILAGLLDKKSGVIDAPIARKNNSIIERCVNKDGAKAVTFYELLDTFNNLSLVKFVLNTGRTHQIRVHSKFIGHPILGDTLYGKPSNLISRQALHCYKICFSHPISKKHIQICAPIPLDMKLK